MRGIVPLLSILAVLALVAALWLPAASAEMRSLPPLAADSTAIQELVSLASRDLEILARESALTVEHDEIQDHVRVRLRNALPAHLLNMEGEPYFDHDITHYLREGRRHSASPVRAEHIAKCPVCNSLVLGLVRGTRVRVPRLLLPFREVFLDKFWYRADAAGYLFKVVDPITGQTSVVPKGRLLMHAGRWWASAGWSWEGPLEEFK